VTQVRNGDSKTTERAVALGRGLVWVVPTVALAWATTRAILAKTGGEAAVPLDDSFIHFEFARWFARLHPLAYGGNATPTPGATSLLWPLVLAPGNWVGLGGTRIIWLAWALGWASLGLLARETMRVGQGLLSKEAAVGAAAMVFAFGGYIWFAGSGMEVVPFAWLLMRSARICAEWGEQANSAASARVRSTLLVHAWLLPAMRPEGAAVSLFIAFGLLVFPRSRSRAWSLLALGAPLGPALFNRMLTGHWSANTTEVKWLFFSPYQAHVVPTIRYHLDLLFSTLLDGRIWSAAFVPQGSRLVAWLALPALLVAGWRQQRRWRALSVLAVALGMFLTTTYDSFLVNRLRYLWPFAAAWFVGLGALADEVGTLVGRWYPPLEPARLLVAGGFAGALASHLSYAIDDLAVSADAIRRQQVSLGLWARDHLPPGSRVGLNDAGAITYLSGLPTFDVVGLTTRSEGRHWVSGPGSRYEHYERLGRNALPTYFIVYPRWMAMPVLLGESLTERSVEGATILGDTTMVAYRARYDALGRAELPLESGGLGSVVDSLDVADLESEQAHDYQLYYATQPENVVLEDFAGHADGARTNRTQDSFSLELVPRGRLVARLAAETPLSLELFANGQRLGTLELAGQFSWEERVLALPAELGRGRHRITANAPPGTAFTSLHYWCVR
jgi:hypothetical protein